MFDSKLKKNYGKAIAIMQVLVHSTHDAVHPSVKLALKDFLDVVGESHEKRQKDRRKTPRAD